ncbi:MAG: hypothetical protein D6753_00025 [Planctomycetota bacterium]|nr:MAG: hypothetical protein D6753_00025 [Planctomycetota bacterium]
MEFACWLVGLALIATGIALFWVRAPNWQDDGDLLEGPRKSIQRWTRLQRAVRILNNVLVILMGALIIATTWLPPGRIWGLAWGVILLVLLVCLLLAVTDALSSLSLYRHALPEAARRAFTRSTSENSQDEHPVA